jgi:hypothetical protein
VSYLRYNSRTFLEIAVRKIFSRAEIRIRSYGIGSRLANHYTAMFGKGCCRAFIVCYVKISILHMMTRYLYDIKISILYTLPRYLSSI